MATIYNITVLSHGACAVAWRWEERDKWSKMMSRLLYPEWIMCTMAVDGLAQALVSDSVLKPGETCPPPPRVNWYTIGLRAPISIRSAQALSRACHTARVRSYRAADKFVRK